MDILDALTKLEEDTSDIRLDLYDLHNAFRSIGNPYLADRLLIISRRLEDSTEMMRNSISESIHKRYSDSQEMSGTIIRACLLGSNNLKKP